MIASTCMAAESGDSGRSVDKVTHPERYPVFNGISDAQGFEDSWVNNRNWVLSNLSHAAYYDKDKLSNTMAPFLGVEEPYQKTEAPLLRFYDVDGAQGFLIVCEDKAVLTFRGTQINDPNDIEADANLLITSFGSSKVHRGFLGEVNKLWDDHILPDLQEFTDGKPVWAAGHSLGAAMAVVAGMRYEFEDVVTIGEPRVGCDIEKEFKAKRHTRIVNGIDPVTKIPPHIPFVYEHHGDEIKIEDPVGGPNLLYDHAPGDYSDYLKA